MNGVAEHKTGTYEFTNAIIMQDPVRKIKHATMIILNGRITAIGKDLAIPLEAIRIDCNGKYLNPSFIDAYSDYCITAPVRQADGLIFPDLRHFLLS